MRKIPVLLIHLLLLFLCSACANLEQFSEQESVPAGAGQPKLQKSSEHTTSKLQSDCRAVLYNSIVMEKGVPMLTLSKEDAISFGIPEEMYDKCQSKLIQGEQQ